MSDREEYAKLGQVCRAEYYRPVHDERGVRIHSGRTGNTWFITWQELTQLAIENGIDEDSGNE